MEKDQNTNPETQNNEVEDIAVEKLNNDSRLVKKIDVKISVVERAIHSIGRDAEVSSKGDSFMLENFLNIDD